jgi:hypothetical protein
MTVRGGSFSGPDHSQGELGPQQADCGQLTMELPLHARKKKKEDFGNDIKTVIVTCF